MHTQPFVAPMECKAVRSLAQIPRGAEWQYEVKFDGYRCIAIKSGKEVTLYSRNGRRFTQFPNVVKAVAALKPRHLTLDGEIVALDQTGRTDFNALQNVGSGSNVHFYAFDLLELNGKDLKAKPLTERQAILSAKGAPSEFIHPSGALDADLDTVAAKVVEFGFEGIIAKRRDSIYTPGRSPGTWLKKKIKETEEFIIGGYIPSGRGVDSIVVGRYAGQDLRFAASVDDGFVPATRAKVFEALPGLQVKDCPFVNLPEKRGRHKYDAEKMRKTVWVRPETVVEIAMNEWTPDGHLRHAEFVRLRPDKTPDEVATFPK